MRENASGMSLSAGACYCESASGPCAHYGKDIGLFWGAISIVSIFICDLIIIIPKVFLRVAVFAVLFFFLPVIAGGNELMPRKLMPAN